MEWRKQIDFINESLGQYNEARTYMKTVDEVMLECYWILVKRITTLFPELEISDFYHPSAGQKNDELLFVTFSTYLATYALYKYLK